MNVFCDWISIYQDHPPGQPLLNGGRLIALDADGELSWQTVATFEASGSYDSKIRLSCDGRRVRLQGNVSRWNRSDNVFGYSVLECVTIANSILAQFGLPPFTASGGFLTADDGHICTGAVITRLDLTCNFQTGSAANCESTINWASGQKLKTKEPRSYGVAGVTWGEGSKFWYAKCYDKARDYLRLHPLSSDHHDSELYSWLRDSGVWRLELGLKSRYLKQKNLWRLQSWIKMESATESCECAVFRVFLNDLVGGVVAMDEYLNIPGRAGELAVAWRDGADLKKRLSRPTFYRYRNQLLKFGIDIAVPSRAERVLTQVKLVKLCPSIVPAFYSLPRVHAWRPAA
jgi:hypothetical protein